MSHTGAALRVVEVVTRESGIASAHAGWLLGKMGATVTRVVDGSASRAGEAEPAGPISRALVALADGKDSIELSSHAPDVDALLRNADVLLADGSQTLARIIAPIDRLRAEHPRLIIAISTVFGLDGPYARFAGTGLDAQALSAVAWSLGEPGRAPLALPPGIVEHQAGAMLAAGCLMALEARDRAAGVGSGRVVDVALADVLASFVAGNCRLYVHHGLEWKRSGRRASGSGGAYPYMILPCRDGEVCICGRTRDEWNRFVQAMGNPEWASLPRYQDLRAMGKQYPDEVDQLLMPWLAQKTKAELEAIALEYNLIVSPIREFDEVLRTAHFRQRGFFRDLEIAGCEVTVPSLPFRVVESRNDNAPDISSTLLAAGVAAPIVPIVVPATASAPIDPPATAAALPPIIPAPPITPPLRPPASVAAPAAADRPLAGIRVLDFGWVWSAPWVGTMLGELGAEIIKVEHALRPDNLRLAGKVIRDGKVVEGPSKEMSPMFHQINHGKLGITLNAKEPRAVELVKQLAASCDIVIENMSPGSMERTKLGYEALRAVNPRIVMLAMSAAGQSGALSTMRAYAPTMSSFVGMEALVGYPGEQPIGALNFALGDPNASVHALAAVLAALRRARQTGQGCYIDFSQIEALLLTLRPYLIDTQINGSQTKVMGSRHPDFAPHGIYPAAGDDAWLTIAVTQEDQWIALKSIARDASWSRDSRFSSVALRLQHVDDLDAAIAAWTSREPRDALVGKLRAAGIASSPVLSVEEQWRDPHYAARGIRHDVQIPVYGNEGLYAAPWKFSDFAPRIDRCAPRLGEHNQRVFGAMLGLSDEEIAGLQQAGVIA